MKHEASVVLPTEYTRGYGVECTCGWHSQVLYLKKAFAYKLAVVHEMGRVDELLPFYAQTISKWGYPE